MSSDVLNQEAFPRGKQCVRCASFADCNQVRMWEKGAVVLVDLCATCTEGLHKVIGGYVAELGKAYNRIGAKV